MVEVLTRVLGKSGRGREQTPAQDNGNNSSSEQPTPTITLYGKIPPDLTNFGYVVGSGDLYNAGFRPRDLILLTLRQNGTSAEVPAYITGILPMESYTGAPTQTVPPSEMDGMPCELSDLLRKDAIRQSLRIEVLGGNGLLTKVLSKANMQGGDEVIKAQVSLSYRLSNEDLDSATRVTLLQRVVDAYPPSVRPYFNGIQLPMPLK